MQYKRSSLLHNTFNKVGRAKSRLRNVDVMSFTDFPTQLSTFIE